MAEFITGLVLGGMMVFFAMECRRWKNYIISHSQPDRRTPENTRWHNLMAYDGSERGQMTFEE